MQKNIYESKPIHALICMFSMPAILSLLIEILTSVVDTIFAGHLEENGTNALTAMGLLTPVFNIYAAFQALYAVSTSILVAKYLNSKKIRDAYFATGMVMSFIVSLLVSLISFWGMDAMLQLIGAKKEVFCEAKGYLNIQLISNLFSAIGYTLTSCIRAFGAPKIEMLVTTLSVAVNILGNAFFSFGLKLGLQGLALGTLVSEIFCMGISIVWLQRKQLFPSIQALRTFPLNAKAWELFRLGFAQTLIQGLGGCTGFFVNHSLMLYATVTDIAIWNMIQKIWLLLLMPIIGITQSVRTMIAYYTGYQQDKKKEKTIRLTLCFTILYGGVATLTVFLLGDQILGLFGVSGMMLLKAVNIVRIVFLTFPVLGIFYTLLTLLEVTGQEVKAVVLTLSRQIFFMLPLIYGLPSCLPKLETSIFWAIPISDVCVLVAALFFHAKKSKYSYREKKSS